LAATIDAHLMANMRTSVLTTAIVVGCSSGGGTAPAPTQCKQSDRTGTYLQHVVGVSGNCGNIADVLVNATTASDTSCTVQSEDWSDGNCKLESTVSCNGGTEILTAVTSQQTDDGSVISGEESIVGQSCSGTYDVTLTRQ
jgi:hypothetical protein